MLGNPISFITAPQSQGGTQPHQPATAPLYCSDQAHTALLLGPVQGLGAGEWREVAQPDSVLRKRGPSWHPRSAPIEI